MASPSEPGRRRTTTRLGDDIVDKAGSSDEVDLEGSQSGEPRGPNTAAAADSPTEQAPYGVVAEVCAKIVE